MSLGSTLRFARERKKLTRQELADLSGVNVNSIAKYERAGERNGQFPPLPILARFAMLLGLSLEKIFTEVADDDDVRKYFEQRKVRSIVPVAMAYNWLDEISGDLYVRMDMMEREIEDDRPSTPDQKNRLFEVLETTFDDDEHYLRRMIWSMLAREQYPQKNGSDQKDPSRPSQNTPKAVGAASNHPKKEDDQK